MEEPLVYCDRCYGPGGQVYRGWSLLCRSCAAEDDSEFFDEGDAVRGLAFGSDVS